QTYATPSSSPSSINGPIMIKMMFSKMVARLLKAGVFTAVVGEVDVEDISVWLSMVMLYQKLSLLRGVCRARFVTAWLVQAQPFLRRSLTQHQRVGDSAVRAKKV